MKIYTASSWKNEHYEGIVKRLKQKHEVYDFRSAISSSGKELAFNWDDIDRDWETWTSEQFLQSFRHPLASNAFQSDYNGMLHSDVCLLILPSGKSSHLEAGFMKGMGKKLIILLCEDGRPELTYRIADMVTTQMDDVLRFLEKLEKKVIA